MPRPVIYKEGWSQWNIMKFHSHKEVYEKIEELSDREGVSMSRLVLQALIEYVKIHYPGQPLPPLESFTPEGRKAIKLEARFIARDLKKLLGKLGNKQVSDNYKRDIKIKLLPKKLIKLARLNQRIHDEEYAELIEEGEKKLE